MSVVSSKRGTTQLEIFIKANELCAYTIKICSNEKNFPKRYRWCLTGKIVDSILEAYKLLICANTIRVGNTLDKDTRENFQNQALGLYEAAISLMDVAFRTFSLKESSVDYWIGLVEEVQKLLKAWKKSDTLRFRDKVDS